MKKLLFVLLAMTAVVAYGNPVDVTTAKQIAEHFWSANAGKNLPVNMLNVTSQTDFHEFYIFRNTAGKGFVMVSADDCVWPILGYSLDNDMEFPLPDNVAGYFEGYEREIAYVKSQNFPQTREMHQMWASLVNNTYQASGITSVAPLLTTLWDQAPYYNALCPQDTDVVPAGCVATAMAQIMKYWNWPVTGKGSHSYTHPVYGVQSADFEATTYDWANMPDKLDSTSTPDQVSAVATLLYHIGVALEMDYGIGGSAASASDAKAAFEDYFRYSTNLHSIVKSTIPESSWINILKGELDNERPVFERGSGPVGGHAFVCDGYDYNGLFHINWGWGGDDNGYFFHAWLNPNPSCSFNINQAIIVDIEPNNSIRAYNDHVTFSVSGGIDSVRVYSALLDSLPWTASSDQSWLTIAPATGAGNGTVTTMILTASANTTDSVRHAMVTITQDTLTTTIAVTQLNTVLCQPIAIPWTEDFAGGAFPECWNISGDNQTDWAVSPSDSNSNYCMKSIFSIDTTPDHWLVTPELILYANSEISFRASGDNAHYGVYVSTTGSSDLSNFTLLGERIIGPTGTWEEDSIDLTAYTGDTVRFAFRHFNGANGPELKLDDVSLTLLPLPFYTVTAMSSDTTMGSVTGGGVYQANTVATLWALANEGYKFVSWNDGNLENPREIVVTDTVTYTALFSDLGDRELFYDNDNFSTNIGNSGIPFYWGVKFPPTSFGNYNSLQSVRIFDVEAGTYNVYIAQSDMVGISTIMAPTKTVQLTGSYSWADVELPIEIPLDTTLPLLVIIGNENGSHPAAVSGFTGNNDGCMISIDGASWMSLTEYSMYYTFMIRAVLDTTNAPIQTYTVTALPSDSTLGSVSGSGTFAAYTGTRLFATAKPGCKFERWSDGVFFNPRNVTLTEDATYTAIFSVVEGDVLSYDIQYAQGCYDMPNQYWGAKFEPMSLRGHHSVKAVQMVNYERGNYHAYLAQGDSVDFSTLEPVVSFFAPGNYDWKTVELPDEFVIDTTLPLWLVFSCDENVLWGAVYGYYCGNPDGSLYSNNGRDWRTLVDDNDFYTWKIRAVLDSNSDTTGVEDVALDNIRVYSTDNRIVVRNAEGQPIRICDIMGREIVSVTNNESVRTFTMPASGVYIVSIGDKFHQKVVVKR